MYLSITGVKNNKLTKYQPCETEAEAIAHAKEYSGFVVKEEEYPSIIGNQEFWIVDKDKKTVTLDQARWDSHQKAITSTQYQRDRALDYPSIQDQLDDLYHNGIDGWKSTIKTTKDKYPKG